MSDTAYLDSITGYYLENLPDTLLSSFVPQDKFTLDVDMMRAFAVRMGIPGAPREHSTGGVLATMAECIQGRLNADGNGCFVRLGSRSPKDSLCGLLPCTKARDVFDMFFFSKRIIDDTHWAYLHGYPVSVFVRPWIEIKEWQEFRCLIRGGRIYGISQYHSYKRQHFPQITHAPRKIATELYTFLESNVLPFAIHNTYTCDVLYQNGNISIIDYNPWIKTTGMCFFSPEFIALKSPEFRFQLDERIGAIPL